MNSIRRTSVLIKTEQTVVIRRQSACGFVVCEQCGEPMISAQASADFFGVGNRVIYRLIEKGEVHFIETEANETYVCLPSVEKSLHEIIKCRLFPSSVESEIKTKNN